MKIRRGSAFFPVSFFKPSWAFVCCALGAGLSVQLAQAQQSTSPAPELNNMHAVTTEFQKLGVRKCLPKIDMVTRFFAGQSRAGVLIYPIVGKPDEGAVSMSMEIVDPNSKATTSYIHGTFVPSAQGCSAVYEMSTYFPLKCDDARAQPLFAAFKPTGVIEQNIQTLALDPTYRMLFAPAGAGCMVVRKQLIP